MVFRIDRELPVPIKAQIRGQVEYAIAYGDLAPGARLPRVHELAKSLQVSPVTVSHAYAELRRRGLVHSRRGLGTFVASDAERQTVPQDVVRILESELARLRVLVGALGVDRRELLQLLDRVASLPSPVVRLRLAFVGVFPEATRSYAAAVVRQLSSGDDATAWTIAEVEACDGALAELRGADAVLCLPNIVPRLRRAVPPNLPIFDVAVTLSPPTVERIANLPAHTPVGVVAAFPEFLAVIKRGVATIAPRLRIVGACLDDPSVVAELSQRSDVLIYASGVVVAHDPARSIEFLHVPDPPFVRDVLVPRLAVVRAARYGERGRT
jgi:DNA-binding transcriptional regulator YhcF (GntR family)